MESNLRIALILAFVVAIPALLVGLIIANAPRREVGVLVVYEIPESVLPRMVNDQSLEMLLDTLDRRLEAGRRPAGRTRLAEDGRIEALIYRDDPQVMQRQIDRLSLVGSLEFRILAQPGKDDELIELATQSAERILRDDQGTALAEWIPLTDRAQESINAGFVTREVSTDGQHQQQVLVLHDPFDVTGEYLQRASLGFFGLDGTPAIDFIFDVTGARRFGSLTQANLPDAQGNARALGIILDGWLQSAPHIHTTITDRGQITGKFTAEEAEDLADVLNSGALPLPIRQVSQRTVEPGEDLTP